MLSFTDAAPVSGVRKTRDGYLVADVRIARCGNIQTYGGSELGKPDMATVRVYRPEGTVFDTAAMASFAHRPVTVNHPSRMVDAENWRVHAVGMTGGEVARDGEFIRVPLVLMDAAAIEEVEAGTREVSCGYACDIAWEPGKTPDGQDYDAMVTRIVGNHLAIVPKGRAGSECRIGDRTEDPTPKEKPTTRNVATQERSSSMADSDMTVVVDGLTITVPHQGFQVITKLQKQVGDAAVAVSDAEQRLRDALAAHSAALAAKDGEIAALQAGHANALQAKDGELAVLKATHETALSAKDGEIAVLQAQVSDEALEARAAARAALVAQARSFLGDGYDPKGKADAEIRKDVVLRHLGDKADPGKPQIFFDHGFEVVVAQARNAPADPLRQAIADGAGTTAVAKDSRPGWQRAAERNAEAWKGQTRVKGVA